MSLYQWFLEHSNLVQLTRKVFLENSYKNVDSQNVNNFIDNQHIFSFTKILFLQIKEEVNKCNSNLKIFYIGWPNWEVKYEARSFLEKVTKDMFFIENNILFFFSDILINIS